MTFPHIENDPFVPLLISIPALLFLLWEEDSPIHMGELSETWLGKSKAISLEVAVQAPPSQAVVLSSRACSSRSLV